MVSKNRQLSARTVTNGLRASAMLSAHDSEASQALRSMLNIGGQQKTESGSLLPGMDPAILSLPSAFPATAPLSTLPPSAEPQPPAQRGPPGLALGFPPGLPPGLMIQARLPGALPGAVGPFSAGAGGSPRTGMAEGAAGRLAGAAHPHPPSAALPATGGPPPQHRLFECGAGETDGGEGQTEGQGEGQRGAAGDAGLGFFGCLSIGGGSDALAPQTSLTPQSWLLEQVERERLMARLPAQLPAGPQAPHRPPFAAAPQIDPYLSLPGMQHSHQTHPPSRSPPSALGGMGLPSGGVATAAGGGGCSPNTTGGGPPPPGQVLLIAQLQGLHDQLSLLHAQLQRQQQLPPGLQQATAAQTAQQVGLYRHLHAEYQRLTVLLQAATTPQHSHPEPSGQDSHPSPHGHPPAGDPSVSPPPYRDQLAVQRELLRQRRRRPSGRIALPAAYLASLTSSIEHMVLELSPGAEDGAMRQGLLARLQDYASHVAGGSRLQVQNCPCASLFFFSQSPVLAAPCRSTYSTCVAHLFPQPV